MFDPDTPRKKKWSDYLEGHLGHIGVVLCTMFVASGVVWSVWTGDTALNHDINQKLDLIIKEQQRVGTALLLAGRDTASDQARISSLESNYNNEHEQVAEVKQRVGVAESRLGDIAVDMHDLLNASRQQIRTPRQ